MLCQPTLKVKRILKQPQQQQASKQAIRVNIVFVCCLSFLGNSGTVLTSMTLKKVKKVKKGSNNPCRYYTTTTTTTKERVTAALRVLYIYIYIR